eukprot:2867045-Rhodomonas_salina.3
MASGDSNTVATMAVVPFSSDASAYTMSPGSSIRQVDTTHSIALTTEHSLCQYWTLHSACVAPYLTAETPPGSSIAYLSIGHRVGYRGDRSPYICQYWTSPHFSRSNSVTNPPDSICARYQYQIRSEYRTLRRKAARKVVLVPPESSTDIVSGTMAPLRTSCSSIR